MYLTFYRTTDVFEAEEILNDNNIIPRVVPTPVRDKAYCGVSLYVEKVDISKSELLLKHFDYKIIE